MPVLTQGGAIFFYQCAQHMDKFVVLKPKSGGKPYWTGKLIGASAVATTTTAAP